MTAVYLKEHFVGREGKPYRPSDDLLAAANTAILLGTPLLLSGEPGCGKTDFAFAAASALAHAEHQQGRTTSSRPLECYVRSDTRARDLLYYYDALRRFGDAQLAKEESQQRAADARPYLRLRPLGEALLSETRRVVLIDEIDKASRDLPNDLLRELEQGHFEITEIAEWLQGERFQPRMQRDPGVPMPLVIITSNAERQLPDAFLRRCVFYYIPFPQPSTLQQILEDRFPDDPKKPAEISSARKQTLGDIIEVVGALREHDPKLSKPPATSELIQWAQALLTFNPAWKGALARVSELAAALRAKKGGIRFDPLPGAHCLLKLREDIEMVYPGLLTAVMT